MNQRSNSATSALRPIMDSVGNCRTSVRCQKRHWVNQWDFGAAVGTMSLSWGVFSTPNGGDQSSKLKSKTDCVGGSLRISHTSKFLTKFARQRAPRQPNEFWGWGSEKSVPKIFGALAVDARGSARRQAHRAHVLSLPSPRRFPPSCGAMQSDWSCSSTGCIVCDCGSLGILKVDLSQRKRHRDGGDNDDKGHKSPISGPNLFFALRASLRLQV